MKKTTLLVALVASFVIGCKNKGSKSDSEKKDDSTHFFQTAVIFQRDLHELDSTPFFIYKKTTINGRADSAAITLADLKLLAQPFLKVDITSADLKPQYKQSVFEDQTTGGFNVNYSTLNKKLEIQSIDVLLKEDGKAVSNILIGKYYDYGDSSAIERMIWKPGERFQILRSVRKNDNSENNYQTLVVWNDKH